MRTLQYVFLSLAAMLLATPAFAQSSGGAAVNQWAPLAAGLGMALASGLCGLGQGAPNPVNSTLRYFRSEYDAHIRDHTCPAGHCTIGGEKGGAQ